MATPTPPQAPPIGGQPPHTPAQASGLPWEDPSRPVFDALVETVKLFVTAPTEAYQRMAPSGSLARPLIYLIVISWIGVVFAQVYSIAFGGFDFPLPEEFSQYSDYSTMGSSVLFNVGVIVLAPFFILIGAAIQLVVFHLMLMLLGAANQGIDATLRVICYAATPQLLAIVPFCGGFAAFIWGVVLLTIGLAVVHSTTHVKALIAILLPLVLCCAACIGLLLMTGVLAAFAAQQ